MNDKLLSELHEKLSKEFLRRLTEEGKDLTAADLNAIRQFLRDNDIQALSKPDTAFGDLIDSLPNFDELPKC